MSRVDVAQLRRVEFDGKIRNMYMYVSGDLGLSLIWDLE